MTHDAHNRDNFYPHTEVEGGMDTHEIDPERDARLRAACDPTATVHQPQPVKPTPSGTVWIAVAPLIGCPGRWTTSLGFNERATAEATDVGLRRDAVIVEVQL